MNLILFNNDLTQSLASTHSLICVLETEEKYFESFLKRAFNNQYISYSLLVIFFYGLKKITNNSGQRVFYHQVLIFLKLPLAFSAFLGELGG